MNTCFAQALTGLCSWIPGSRAVPAPRKDIVFEFPDGLLRGGDDTIRDLRSTVLVIGAPGLSRSGTIFS
jgi:hypothetical protein